MFWRSRRISVLLGACVLVGLSGADGAEPLRLRVSPAMSVAPGFVTVQVSVEEDGQNRLLEVVAESPDFYRRSLIQLDGANAPRLTVIEFRDLPTGLYQVTGTLIGSQGTRATAQRLAKVAPSPGSVR